MSSLTTMSDNEISKLLDEYGIKHGPVIDSTRGLYERKLNEAMFKAKQVKPASDQTFYREEEEEITYVYTTPVRGEETPDSEISKLLDEHGIKHGPVVDSTRGLYERKLNEAMSKAKQVKPASDQTFYREEEEEITYVYTTPVRGEETPDSCAYMRSRPHWTNHEKEATIKTISSLSTMSDNEIRKLLDEYGVKHGPVIGTTRSLYERKLNESMSKAK